MKGTTHNNLTQFKCMFLMDYVIEQLFCGMVRNCIVSLSVCVCVCQALQCPAECFLPGRLLECMCMLICVWVCQCAHARADVHSWENPSLRR